MNNKKMRILSIDGGGIRGLIPAAVLAELERLLQERTGDQQARIADYFDLVAGTSTGGLIGGLLLVPDDDEHDAPSGAGAPRPKMKASDIVDFLMTFGPELFYLPLIERLRRLGGLIDERYGSDGFNRALDEALGTPGTERALSELLRPTVITTYNASTGRPYFFKQHRTGKPDGRDFNLRAVALATSAAPTYFETPYVVSDLDPLGACVDGGIFANNPTMCAYAEAHSFFGHGAADMAVLSLGTGTIRHTYEHSKMRNWGALSWMGPMFEMILSASATVVDYQIRQIFDTLGQEAADSQYLRLQVDLAREPASTVKMDNTKPANMHRLVEIGRELVDRNREQIDRFFDKHILESAPVRVRPTLSSVVDPSPEPEQPVAPVGGPPPSRSDRFKVAALTWMRLRNRDTVDQGSVDKFRRRRVPMSGMPQLVRACAKYPHMSWLPKELMVPDVIPKEAHLPLGYYVGYYGLAKGGFKLYNKMPIQADVAWDPSFAWNRNFPPTGDGWQHPTSDATFTRLRLQGPNPWLLRRVADQPGSIGEPEPTFEVDYSSIFAGVLPSIVAQFAVRDDQLVPTEIAVGSRTHHPGDETWAQAKRVANAADARYVAFGRHLLNTHMIVGQAFALAAYSLPTWHDLRPFMQFFTYGTLAVNDTAYGALVKEGSYFVESGFVSITDADRMFTNMVGSFDLDEWIVPRDIAARQIDAIPDHPYVDDALLVWPAFVQVVERHLADRGLDDATISNDPDLQTWYLTLSKLLPNTDPRERPLDRARLVDLCTALLWNNVVHEICGDLSPILGSEDPRDKALINLAKLREAIADGDLTTPIEPPTMSDVFLLDQASFVSRFNVGGNNILQIEAARMVDDPKLRDAIIDLQNTLRTLETQLIRRNDHRAVRFNRMLPRHWEASISF